MIDRVAELMMIKFGESGHQVFRATSPLSRGTLKSKGCRKLSYHFCADGDTIETVFRTIISVNQLSIYGAVSDLCEEYGTCQTRTGRPVLAEQSSDPLFEPASLLMTTPTPSTEDPAQEDLLHKYQERVEWLSQQNRVIKICTDAGFLTTDGVGQYFMTKDTDEFSQFTESVACREYTLPRDAKSSDPKGWIRGNTKIGPVLEVTTSYLQGKYGVEFRIESVNKDNSHSWCQNFSWLKEIGHKLEQQGERQQRAGNLRDAVRRIFRWKRMYLLLQADQKPKQNHEDVLHKNYTYWGKNLDRYWARRLFASRLFSVETTEYSSSSWPSTSRRQCSDWVLENKERSSERIWDSQHWCDEMWKSKMAGGGGNKKIFQYCTDPSGQEILYLRALQGHSGRNPIDPSLKDNVFIPNNFFECMYHVGCAINLHSIINSGLIPGGQILSKRRTVFFTSVDPMNKEHKDPDVNDLEAPRLAWYHQKKWKKHQYTVYWVDIKLGQQKGLKFYQTRSNAIIFYDTLPAYCIPKAIMMESGEIIYEKVLASPRPPPKISFKDNWMKELGSEVAGGGEDSQQIKPRSKTHLSSTVRLVKSEQPSGLLTQGDRKRCLVWLRKHKLKNGETCKELCASVCWTFR